MAHAATAPYRPTLQAPWVLAGGRLRGQSKGKLLGPPIPGCGPPSSWSGEVCPALYLKHSGQTRLVAGWHRAGSQPRGRLRARPLGSCPADVRTSAGREVPKYRLDLGSKCFRSGGVRHSQGVLTPSSFDHRPCICFRFSPTVRAGTVTSRKGDSVIKVYC